jgi:hypothetical protein
MRSGMLLGLVWLAAVLAAGPLRAEDAPQASPQGDPQANTPAAAPDAPKKVCEVPDSLLTTDSTLPKVTDAVKASRSLNILGIGGQRLPGTAAGRAEREVATGHC